MPKLPALILSALLLAACGPGNTVQLLPPPPIAASSIPSPSAPSVSVVNFKDSRLDPAAIGKRRDGSAFTTSGDAATWISRALADDLARMGLRVTFAMSADVARKSNPDYLVTGDVNEIWLKETSATSMTAQMRITCALANRKGKLWTESCNTSQSRSGLPSGSAANELLLEALRDLIKPVADKITQTAEARK